MRAGYALILLFLGISHFDGIVGKRYYQKYRSSSSLASVAESNTLFANDLYREVTNVEGGNLILSPFSLSSALTMVRAGARRTTAESLHKNLRLENIEESKVYDGYAQLLSSLQKDKSVSLEIANNVYVEKSYDVRDEFLDLLRTNFRAGSSSINFGNNHQAAETINTWVGDVTRNRIQELVSADQISKDTKMILINAIYFKGIWKKAFPLNGLASRPFYTNENDFVNMDMMAQRGNYLYAKVPEIDASVALLPYQGDRISLIILLPRLRSGLAEMETKLMDISLTDIRSKLELEYLSLTLPRFKLESTYDFIKNKVLGKLGMGIMSSKQADFTGISQTPGLYVDQVIQKAFIEINEQGTEATAATASGFANRVAHIAVPFTVDHPFLAYIYDEETKSILFMIKKID